MVTPPTSEYLPPLGACIFVEPALARLQSLEIVLQIMMQRQMMTSLLCCRLDRFIMEGEDNTTTNEDRNKNDNSKQF